MTPGTQFKADLDAWLALSTGQLEALARQSIQALAERVVETTPIDTGFLRGSWQPNLNVLPPPRADDDSTDSTGDAALGRVGIVVSGIRAGDTFYMVNNARYGMRLEFGFVGADSLGRVYNQAGRYFVTRAIAAWPDIVANEARDLGFLA